MDCSLKQKVRFFLFPWKEEDEAAENGGGALPPSSGGVGGGGGGGRDDGQPSARRDKALPFEFRALEVCLEFSCKSLEQEVRACCPVRGQRGQITVCVQGSSQLLLSDSLMLFGISSDLHTGEGGVPSLG